MLETETLSETLGCYSIPIWLIALGNYHFYWPLKLCEFLKKSGKNKEQVVHMQAIKGYGGFVMRLHYFFTTALDGCGHFKGLVALSLGNKPSVPVQ